MSCGLTKGKARGCRSGFAGIKAVDFAEWDALESVTITNKLVTAITLADGYRTYRYELDEEVGNFGDVFAGNRQNGTGVWTQTLTMPLNNFDSTTEAELENVVQNRLIAVVHYSDGTYKLAGHEVGLMVDSGTHNSGTAHEDRNGMELVLSCKQKTSAPFIGAGLVAALQVPAS